MSIRLEAIGTYENGIFGEDTSAAEIVAHDPSNPNRLFVSNSVNNTVDVLDISDPTNPSLLFSIDLSAFGGNVNSVAVKNGIVAAAVQSDTKTDPGTVAFFDVDGNYLNDVAVGALPDMVTFTPDGTKVLVANEGEPDAVNPEGSVSIIDLSGGVAAATVETVGFTAFNGKEAALRNIGVRIADGVSAAQDFEPESITVTPDGSRAYVTLQENNAVAVIDIASATVLDIKPLGLKDFSQGLPELTTYDFDGRPVLGTTALGEEILLGGFSGLHFEGTDPVTGNLKFITVGDRGPNGDPVAGERPFLLPDYQARVVRFELNQETGEIQVTEQIALTREDGTTPITGLPNIPGFDEVPVEPVDDGSGGVTFAPLPYDPFGADIESITLDPDDGSFWMVDEYRPAIYHFDSNGTLIDRFVPEGTAALADPDQPVGTYGTETLPAEYSTRVSNRGFEAGALDAENDVFYAFIQTPLANPDAATSSASNVIRILAIDTNTGEPVGEYVYLLEKPSFREAGGAGLGDKIGDAVYLGDGRIAVVERDSSVETSGKKYIFEVDLKSATNVLGTAALPPGETLEQQTADSLAALGISPVFKLKVANLPSLGYLPNDKTEGLAALDDGSLAVLNDNDFGVTGNDTVQLGIISFTGSNTLDASDQDGGINLQHWPVFGTYMPDGAASFVVNGKTYFITANEGDDRGEDARIGSGAIENNLDPDAFPDTSFTANDAAGRLTISEVDGDIDGDGDYDLLQMYGARSFSIWDEFGNLVYDSGDEFERITAARLPQQFNADNVSNDFDNRSDNKGPEPEGVAAGEIDGHIYAFVGLERVGGVMVYDVTDPANAEFVQYITARDFSETPGPGTGGDLAPEGLVFIAAEDSPNGSPLLAVANEVSGSTTIFEIDLLETPAYTLQILHASDLEAGADAIERAPNFAAIVDYLEDTYDDSITLIAGDTFIPSPFLFAGGDPSLAPMYNSVYNQLFGLPADVNDDAVPDAYADLRADTARADVTLMNIIGVDAASLGNHEFDLGTTVIRNAIQPNYQGAGLDNDQWAGAQFPYLAANLDFSADTGSSGLADLFTSQILPNTAFASGPEQSLASQVPKKIAPATIIEEGGELIGVIGVDTPLLESISSPGKVQVIGPETDDDAALTILAQTVIQPVIDQLEAMGVNKIIIASQLQQFDNEQFLATQLDGVDVIIAGGSDTLLADDEDVSRGLRPGDTPDGDYPFVTQDLSGNDVLVVSLDGHYSYVGRLVVDFDADGHIIVENLDPAVNGAYATTDEIVTSLWGNSTDPFAEGTKGDLAQEVVDAVEDLILVKDSNIVGRTDVFLEGRRSEVRTEETNLGDLTADANLALAKQSDPTVLVSIKNGGGIRDAIGTVIQTGPGEFETAPPQANPLTGKETGEISQLDIENSLRFNNGLSLVTVTAAQLLQVLEHAVAAVAPGATPGQFGQVGGVEFSYDPTRSAGDRVLSAAIVDENGNLLDIIAANGAVAGDPDRAIRVVTLTFLLTGGDSYPFNQFIAADPAFANRVDLLEDLDPALRSGAATFAPDGSEQDALAEYLLANFPADDDPTTPAYSQADTGPDLDERIQNLAFRPDTVLGEGDLIQGDGGNNVINGKIGSKTILAGGGDDNVNAGIGDDLVLGGDGNDRLNGGIGNDTLNGDAGNDVLDGGIGNDTLNGGTGNDTLDGGVGDDVLDGGADNDILRGGVGNDNLDGGTGNDNLDGGTGDDVLNGGDGDDRLVGATGNDTLDGGIGNDSLNGGLGNDLLIGDEGDDRLIGDLGNDTLVGGEGNDTFTGGLGADVIVIGPDSGADIVTDFKANQDVIDLSALFDDFAAIQGLLSQNGANTVLAIDAGNGDVLTLNNVNLATLDANDFVF
ncbi:MAG: choice-of-anchor I family protein [Alphaproteobacteria bacterium]